MISDLMLPLAVHFTNPHQEDYLCLLSSLMLGTGFFDTDLISIVPCEGSHEHPDQ